MHDDDADGETKTEEDDVAVIVLNLHPSLVHAPFRDVERSD